MFFLRFLQNAAMRPLRLNRGQHHARVHAQIDQMGYDRGGSNGFCQGGALLYAYARITGQPFFNEWMEFLLSTPKFGEHLKNIDQKKQEGLPLSDEETLFLEGLPGADLRAFLDHLVVLQVPDIVGHRPFLLHPVKNQRDVENAFLATLGEGQEQPIACLFKDAVIKTDHELHTYLSDIVSILKSEEDDMSSTQSYVFLVRSETHCIALMPNMTSDGWEMFDFNQAPCFEFAFSEAAAEIKQALIVQGKLRPENYSSYGMMLPLFFTMAFLSAYYFTEKYTACSISILTAQANPKMGNLVSKLNAFQDSQILTHEIARRKTQYGTTLLNLAVGQNLINLTKNLVSLVGEEDLNCVNYKGFNAVDIAALEGHDDILKLLLSHGAAPSQPKENKNPFLYMASQGSEACMEVLLDEAKRIDLDVDAHNEYQRTALYLVSCHGYTRMVRMLLDAGADPQKPNDQEQTPLMAACQMGHPEIVHLICQKYAATGKSDALNKTDTDGWSALKFAVEYGQADVIQILADYGVDVGSQKTIERLIMNENVDAIKILHKNQIRFESIYVDSDKKEFTYVHYAVFFDKKEIIRCFADLGVDFNCVAPLTGESAIAYAMRREKWEVAARMLMSTKAPSDINRVEFQLMLANKTKILLAYEEEKAFSSLEAEGNYIGYLLKIENSSECIEEKKPERKCHR